MSRLLRATAVSAALATGCLALQVAPDGPRVCASGTVAYEAVQGASGVCDVYCVPEGQCELMAQTGKLKAYGITGQGGCKRTGFTEAKAFGNVSLKMQKWLKTLTGPCKGMTLVAKLQKPAAAAAGAVPAAGEPTASSQGATQEGPVCAYEHTPYEAIIPAYPGVCSVYCVPEGQCTLIAAQGNLAYLGVTEQGNCRRKGYTVRSQPSNKTKQMQTYLSSLAGPCAGMTIAKFQMPPAEEPPAEAAAKQGQVCRRSQTAFEAIAESNPSMCSVYCMPEGDCVGQVQSGSMSHLGIVGEGNCHGKGFTERMQYTTPWAKHVQGPCQGMDVTHFQRPGLMEQKSAPEQGMCGREQKAFEAISRLYPNVCQVFCVPEGDCEGRVIMGQLGALGITGEGNCKKRGFTEARAVGKMSSNTLEWVRAQHGSCKGITIQQFNRPSGAAAPAAPVAAP